MTLFSGTIVLRIQTNKTMRYHHQQQTDFMRLTRKDQAITSHVNDWIHELLFRQTSLQKSNGYPSEGNFAAAFDLKDASKDNRQEI